MTDGRLISSIYKELLEGKKIKYKIEQKIQEGSPQENKNKWLNKGKNANLIHFEQMQNKTKVYNIFLPSF